MSQNPRDKNATRRIERSVVLDAIENSNNKETEKLPLDFATVNLEVFGKIDKKFQLAVIK